MARRILIGCYEVPGWGGAATAAYLLFERMQRDGWDVAYVNLVSARDDGRLRALFGDDPGNPRALADVHTCRLEDPLWREHAALADVVRDRAPDVLLGFGFIAARLMKQAAPAVPLVFMTAGSYAVQQLIETGAVADFIGFERGVRRGVSFPAPAVDRERAVLEQSDLVFVHSPLVRLALEHWFPEHAGRIYAETVSIADLCYGEAERFGAPGRPFAERDVDVVFVASSWRRAIKNYALVRRIVARSAGLRVHVVGEVDEPCPGARHHGVVAGREELYALLGRARVLVCPSLVDAAPGVLFEASAMGCNVIASPNCGNWRLCHQELRVPRGSVGPFVDAIARGQRHPYRDHRADFAGGYAELVETLRVL